MDIDVYVNGSLPTDLDRDDIEDALMGTGHFRVIGAGTGPLGCNLDLQVVSTASRQEALRTVAAVLHGLELAHMTHVRVSMDGEPGERIEIADLAA